MVHWVHHVPHYRDTLSTVSLLTRHTTSDIDQTKDAGDDGVCPLGETLTTFNTSALHYMSDGFIKPSISY